MIIEMQSLQDMFGHLLTNKNCCGKHQPAKSSQVMKLTDGSKRRRLTEIVNSYLKHDEKGKLIPNADHPMFVEIERRSKEKYLDKGNTGPLDVGADHMMWVI